MPTRSTDDSALRDAALAVLVTTLTGEIRRFGDAAERVAVAVERVAEAIISATAAANPWVVIRLWIERVPGWGLVAIPLIPLLALALRVAPTVGDVLVQLVTVAK
jgi:prepilin signal peptidase PulO-like enzyme (type II secretory pathway)